MARRVLAAAPATLPLAAAVALLAGWGIAGGAQAPTTWGWGAAALVVLLAATVRALPLRLGTVPPATRLAAAALAAYTLWSFASIAWAGDRGAALEGASRTLLYLVVFVLFAAWRQRGASAAALLGAWTLALAVFAGYVVLRLPGADAAQQLFLGENRLAEPTGYPNAAAALWLMPLWPALALSAARDVPWGLRGVFGAAAVLFAGLGLLTGSRGAFIAVPVVLALTFLAAPDRVRRMVSLVPLAACFAAAVPALLRVEDHPGGPPVDVLTSAGRALLLAAVAAGAIVTIGAFLEERRPVRAEAEARAHRVLGALGLAVVLGALVAGAAWLGNPSQRADDAWASFKQGYGENRGGNRLTSGLGSNRYDFYRVALDVFAAHPIAGAGADNFQQEYLARGRSEETPRYPHSVELRALSETGAIGAALLLIALVAGVAAGLRGTRARDPLARAAAVGALGAFAYWLVHGSADWFFEIAGLGAPAFAWLGLAAALAPRPEEEHDPPRWPLLYGRPGAWPAALAAVLAVVVLLAPWLARQDQVRAAQAWRTDPAGAYARLDRARALDPLSDGPDLLAGSIAVRSGDLRRADAAFARALARNPRGSYATLQRGAIASQLGHRAAAVTLLARAAALAPRDRLTRYALSIARGGGRVDVARLNEAILAEARGLAG